MEMPSLALRDAVPVRGLAGLEQIVDRRRMRIAEGLAEPAAFGMPLELERADDGVGVRHSVVVPT